MPLLVDFNRVAFLLRLRLLQAMTVLEPDDVEKLQEWSVLFVHPIPILTSTRRRLAQQYEHHWHALVRATRPPYVLYVCPNNSSF